MYLVSCKRELIWRTVFCVGLFALLVSPKLFAYNSFRVKTQPSEIISNNAQISYKELFTSAGVLKSNIHGLVGLVKHYGIFKLSCAADGGVRVDHNILSAQHKTLYLDGKAFVADLSYGLPEPVIANLKVANSVSFAQEITNTAGEIIPANQAISLVGFEASYYRVSYLCNEQQKVTAALRL
ncbi:hypothetical protein [Agarivorans litoreus]|uniref:hypothetical protein n=1 Tax=Agarivorans litoreus TaxID=1510455 RepID=UPI001C7E0C2D|nr:hypothetical protein [Agarivorans litoreus]